jgi:hypothetical protein
MQIITELEGRQEHSVGGGGIEILNIIRNLTP